MNCVWKYSKLMNNIKRMCLSISETQMTLYIGEMQMALYVGWFCVIQWLMWAGRLFKFHGGSEFLAGGFLKAHNKYQGFLKFSFLIQSPKITVVLVTVVIITVLIFVHRNIYVQWL